MSRCGSILPHFGEDRKDTHLNPSGVNSDKVRPHSPVPFLGEGTVLDRKYWNNAIDGN